MDATEGRRHVAGRVFKAEELEWVDLAGHMNAALTKLLVTRENCGSQNIDFYISSYAPKAFAELHHHEQTEEVFYFLSGTGIFELDGERHLVGANTVVYVPPRARHAIYNTGFENLVFIVTGTPPEAEFHERYKDYFASALVAEDAASGAR
jgi:mannose-6-phosphate isomerase-like protein (cupin superfamily)